MEVEFQTADLCRLCEDSRHAQRVLGAPCAKKLRARISDLISAPRLSDVTAGRPHALVGDREGQYALRLQGGIRLVLEPTDDPLPMRNPSGIDWPNVTAIRVVLIGDYHD